MGKELFDSLKEQAAVERGAILEKASVEARAIVEKARENADQERDELLAAARAEAETISTEIVNGARLKGKKFRLLSQHRIAEKALAELEKRVKAFVTDPDRSAVLERLLLECAVGEGSIITCRREDRVLLEKIIAVLAVPVHIETASIPLGGIMVTSPDRLVVEKNTFEDRMMKVRPLLLSRIASFLASPVPTEKA